jgi:hypothetical protein
MPGYIFKKCLLTAQSVFCLSILLFPLSLGAESVTVTNSVSAGASTGGNSASASSGSSGQSSASVKVRTTVNGEEVIHVEEHVTSEGGDPIEISISEDYASESGDPSVQTSVRAHAENGASSAIHTNVSAPAEVGRAKREVSDQIAETETAHAADADRHVVAVSGGASAATDPAPKRSFIMGFFGQLLSYVFKLF